MNLLCCPRAVRGRAALLAATLSVLLGCSANGGRVAVPAFSPDAAAARALADYDTNKDGFLDSRELERCPALKDSLKTLDRDRDGRLSTQEIADRLAAYQRSAIGRVNCSCQVRWEHGPLVGALVTFVPEAFLGPSFKPASGVSDEHGRVVLKMDGEEQPGLACGFYRITVSKKDASGRETIPARYNERTILGREVGPAMRRGLTLHLTQAGS
ncbi:MAG TPA: hypothetical protein VFA18_04970 [Gemmataceae bacterium]|nr:hypothetical protein [Gemmataceae bacterium]